MASAGSHLHALRELHGVSLDDLAQATRINRRFLEALEADDFAALPAGPFAKGFIRSYCEALGESAEEPLALYGAAATARVPRRQAAAPPRGQRSLAPVLVSLALLVILGVALATVTIALRSGRGDGEVDGRDMRSAQPVTAPEGDPTTHAPAPTGPGLAATARSADPAARARASAVEVPSERAAPERALAPVPASQAPYRLVARASDPTWIRVRMEGGRTTEETIPAGEVREWISNRPFELQVGNAGGIALELNGRALPPLGARGTVIQRLVVPAEPR